VAARAQATQTLQEDKPDARSGPRTNLRSEALRRGLKFCT
jgi:hypothetical protein